MGLCRGQLTASGNLKTSQAETVFNALNLPTQQFSNSAQYTLQSIGSSRLAFYVRLGFVAWCHCPGS